MVIPKDRRPDLKQLLVSLVVTGDSRFPLWMEALNGNSSDKVNFHETLSRVQAFQQQMGLNNTARWVADSALYTQERLAKASDYLWLTRVPETLKLAQELVETEADAIAWDDGGDGYQIAGFEREYGGVKQRWLLVQSAQAYQREMATFEKYLEKQETHAQRAADALSRQRFGCEQDAADALAQFAKGQRWFTVDGDIVPQTQHTQRGRPKAGAEPAIVGYRVGVTLRRDETAIAQAARKKGRFYPGHQ